MCGNSYEWDKITEAMMIQLDRPDGDRARERDSGGAPRGRFAGRRWNTGAYEAEPVHDDEQWYDESYAATADDDEDVEALAADLDELEAVMEDVDLEELTQ